MYVVYCTYVYFVDSYSIFVHMTLKYETILYLLKLIVIHINAFYGQRTLLMLAALKTRFLEILQTRFLETLPVSFIERQSLS